MGGPLLVEAKRSVAPINLACVRIFRVIRLAGNWGIPCIRHLEVGKVRVIFYFFSGSSRGNGLIPHLAIWPVGDNSLAESDAAG